MDAVLFGAPKPMNSYIKDWILVISLIVALGGCWFAFVQHRYSKNHIMNELESLQRAEDSLRQMQDKLHAAKEENESAVREQQCMEAQLKDEITKAKREAERLRQVRKANVGGEDTVELYAEKLRLADEELIQVRSALQETERQLDELMGWSPPSLLQQWLQMTHEVEFRYYMNKKAAAERKLFEAKEVCIKLRRRRGTFIGAFRMAHGNSMDEVDTKLERARTLLTEVTTELRERMHRWTQIEMLCNFPVVNNPGFQVLAGALGLQNVIDQVRGTETSVIGSVSHLAESNTAMGIEECDDDVPPIPPLNLSAPSGFTVFTSLSNNKYSTAVDLPSSLPLGKSRPIKTTRSLHNLTACVPKATQNGAPIRNSVPVTTPTFYLSDSVSEGYSRQESDASNSTNNSTSVSVTSDAEHSLGHGQVGILQIAPKVKKIPASISESSLSSIYRNGKGSVRKDGTISPINLEEDETSSIGSASDLDDKKRKKKFNILSRKTNRSSKNS